jgi:hypothetical protein
LECFMHHSQLLLRAEHSEGLKCGSCQSQVEGDFGNETIGGHDVGKTEVPNRVEDRGHKHRHILCNVTAHTNKQKDQTGDSNNRES